MTNDPIFQRWRELSWRGKLSGAEQAELRAWLTEHPEAMAEWEAEVALNDVLNRLPDAPVASNFTARAVAAVGREKAGASGNRHAETRGSWRRWFPRMAVAVVVLGAGLFGHHESVAARRAKMAHSVEVVSKVSILPSPAILEDFDAIQRLTPAPAADEALLSLLE
jgi:anti-sigma factor RsiW